MGTSPVTSVAPSYDSDKLLQLGLRLSVFPESAGGEAQCGDVGTWWDLYEAKPTCKYWVTDTSEENDRLLMGSKMGCYKRVSLTPPHLSPFPFIYPYTVMASIMKKHS